MERLVIKELLVLKGWTGKKSRVIKFKEKIIVDDNGILWFYSIKKINVIKTIF